MRRIARRDGLRPGAQHPKLGPAMRWLDESGQRDCLAREVDVVGDRCGEAALLHELERDAMRQAQFPQPGLPAAGDTGGVEGWINKLNPAQGQLNRHKIFDRVSAESALDQGPRFKNHVGGGVQFPLLPFRLLEQQTSSADETNRRGPRRRRNRRCPRTPISRPPPSLGFHNGPHGPLIMVLPSILRRRAVFARDIGNRLVRLTGRHGWRDGLMDDGVKHFALFGGS